MTRTRAVLSAAIAAVLTASASATARADGPQSNGPQSNGPRADAPQADAPQADPRRYDLQRHDVVGEAWTFDQSSGMSMTIQVGPAGQGGQGGQQVQQAGGEKRAGTATVLAVRDGAPSALTVTFAPDCAASQTQNGQRQDKPFPLAGKTVRVKKDEMGVVEIDGADTDPATTAELTKMVTVDRSCLPPRPVSVGDEWAGDPAQLAKELGLGPNDSATVKCRLARLTTVAGRPAAEVALTIASSKTENGATTKMTIDGTAQTDVATGQTLQLDMAGKLDISGQTDTPQGQVPVQGDGKMEVHQTLHPTAGFAAAPVTVPAPVPASVAAADPTQVASPQRNPLDPDPPPAPFAGTFKNGKITVQLQPAGPAGQYAGTIAMGDRTFPATAHADGNRLAGTFQSGGTAFEFTATINGPALEMTSGKNTFELQKDAPPNPLDTAAGPANPLAK